MAKFVIGYNAYYCRFYDENPDDYAIIELSDEQIDRLVALMRETGEINVYGMELDEKYPDIFDILYEASIGVIARLEMIAAEMYVYYETISGWDTEKMLRYAKLEGFEYDENEDVEEWRAAREWLDNYMKDPDNLEEFIDFIGWEPDCVDYNDREIVIPREIIDMAFPDE